MFEYGSLAHHFKVEADGYLASRTLAPSLANMIAVAFPMPVEAPVTRATLPSSLPGMIKIRLSDVLKPYGDAV